MRFLLGSTFFGLSPEYRLAVFSQIHEIVFHGQGGYDWPTVYAMPIWLRNYTYNKIKEFYDIKNNAEQRNAEDSWLNNTEARQEANKNKLQIPEVFKQRKLS